MTLCKRALLACGAALMAAPAAAQIELLDIVFLQFEFEERMTADIALADVDGDGDLDVLAANGRHWAQPDFVYLNHGDGRLLEALPIGRGPSASYRLEPGDFDGDGDIDVVMVRDTLPALAFANDGHGNFTLTGALEGSGGAARSSITIDANADGLPDIVVARRRGEDLLLLGLGGMKFAPAIPLAGTDGPSTGLATADFNGDGHPDLAIARREGAASLLLLGDGKGGFAANELKGTPGDNRKLLAADIDGDGDMDLVLGQGDGTVALLANDGRAHFSAPSAVWSGEEAIQALASLDVDADGDIDLAVGVEGRNSLLRNDGGRFARLPLDEAEADTYGLASGDLNGDGRPDIALANSESANQIVLNRTKSAP